MIKKFLTKKSKIRTYIIYFEDALLYNYLLKNVNTKYYNKRLEGVYMKLNENINNITNIINNENKYYTYKVYIVREGDTLETICSKYNVTPDDLKEYNNINEINVGDKIIIQQINE